MNVINKINKIAIVGGGTAGWIAAAALARACKAGSVEIILVESTAIGTIGVGEATIPPMVNFLQYLGVEEKTFIAATNATYKLGIKFQDWYKKGQSYWHPFGSIGVNIDGNPFFHYWLRRRQQGSHDALSDFSPAAVMAEAGKYYSPHNAPPESFLAGVSYAYHFDAGLVAQFLRKFAEQKGVTRIPAEVTDIEQAENGFINAVVLNDGTKLTADFFIDCTGFRSLLIDGAMRTDFVDLSDCLPCDRAVVAPSGPSGDVAPYTLASAGDAGWTWKIPLQNRVGNGYVYASAFCDDDQALRYLKKNVHGTLLADPQVIHFKTGYRQQMWQKNCLSLGLASGFIEPLESTAIHLIVQGIKTFINLFPDKHCNPALAAEYNRVLVQEYEKIKEFIVLHYCTTARDDSEFWRWCRHDMPVSPELNAKIALFKAQGRLQATGNALFKDPSWYSVFLGMGIEPEAHDPLIACTDIAQVESILFQVKGLMKKMVEGLPAHHEYLDKLMSRRA